jgi:hypothetical protein
MDRRALARRFYIAGYEGRTYPLPLNQIAPEARAFYRMHHRSGRAGARLDESRGEEQYSPEVYFAQANL